MTARHKSYAACIKRYAEKCSKYKKTRTPSGKYSKKTKAARNKAKAKRDRINAKRAAAGRKDFIKRPYSRKALQAAVDAAGPATM